jgi:hypothetical protein
VLGTISLTSTPRPTAAISTSINWGSGTKYAFVMRI